jgi:hypothetical protein
MLIFTGMIRTILFAAILMLSMGVKAQLKYPQQPGDTSSIHNKWSITKYAGISTGFLAFKGGSSSFFSVPLSWQINRQLTNNLYAFGNVSVAPYLFHFNNMPYQAAANKNNSFMQNSNLSIYSDAKIGVMYISNDRTFSVSGSIGVSRGLYNSYSPFLTPISGNHQY